MAHEKVMFGSDSAPHPRDKKEAPGCAAGVFTAPVALPGLAAIFEEAGVLENLQKFVSDNAQKIYGITPPKKEVILKKEPFEVPESYEDVVPMFSQQTLPWRIESVI